MNLDNISKALALSAIVAISILASDVVKIGVQAPITAEYATAGQRIDKIVRKITKEKNAAGGL